LLFPGRSDDCLCKNNDVMSGNVNQMILTNRKERSPNHASHSFVTEPTPTSACYIKTNETKRRKDKNTCEPVC